jgi:hypothetical protein
VCMCVASVSVGFGPVGLGLGSVDGSQYQLQNDRFQSKRKLTVITHPDSIVAWS